MGWREKFRRGFRAKKRARANKKKSTLKTKQGFLHKMVADKIFNTQRKGRFQIPMGQKFTVFKTNVADLETKRLNYIKNKQTQAFGMCFIDFIDYYNREVGQEIRNLRKTTNINSLKLIPRTISYKDNLVFSYDLFPKFHFEFLKQNIDLKISACRFQHIPPKNQLSRSPHVKAAKVLLFGSPKDKAKLWLSNLLDDPDNNSFEGMQKSLLGILVEEGVSPLVTTKKSKDILMPLLRKPDFETSSEPISMGNPNKNTSVGKEEEIHDS